MDLKLAELPPLERYKLLIGLVIPRPIAWISTWSPNGVANCAPFSFFNVFSEEPPLCVIGIHWSLAISAGVLLVITALFLALRPS